MKYSSRFIFIVLTLGAAATVYFVILRPRLHAEEKLASAASNARPSVNVVIAERAPAAVSLKLPASIQAFQDTPIYARTNGYLRRWLVDIGDEVKAGQLLAEIDSPEVEQELNQARAVVDQAKANLSLAQMSATRWKELGAQRAVAQQEVDEKQAALAARQADLHSVEANVQRLTELKSFEIITAPFAGVITTRTAEIGTLISAGSAGHTLYRLAQIDPLRVFVNIPQSYLRSVRLGMPAELTVPEYSDHIFKGTVARASGALDASSRTRLTEIQIPNPKGELMPGMFGEIQFKLDAMEPAIMVPSGAIITRADGARVAVLNQEHVVHFAKVKLGRDFGTQMEVLSGLDENTPIVSSPSDSLSEGVIVDPLQPAKK